MNCLECQDLLHSRLDGDNQAASPALDQHLASCELCRHNHAAGTLMLEGLKALAPVPELRPEFTQRLVDRIIYDRHKRRVRMKRRAWITAGLAAAILIIVFVGNFWPAQPNPTPIVDNHKQQEAPAVKQIENQAEEKGPAFAQKMEEAGSDILALTNRVAQEPARLLVSIRPRDLPGLPNGSGVSLEPATQSLRQAGQGMSEGLNTVSRNAGRAVSFFINELPVLDSSN